MKNFWGYNIKLLFSPLKWSCCFIFIILISLFMYAPTYYDFTNICEIYIPFIGVILMTDIMLIDKYNNISEILYISDGKLKKVFVVRYLIVAMFIIFLSFSANIIFFIQGYFKGELYLNEPITFLEFLIVSVSSTLFLGTLSMTIANFSSNQYIAYGCSLIYWLYWNINSTQQSILNLFPFVAKPTDYVVYIFIEFIIIIFLILINSILSGKSPFFITDRFFKLIMRFFKAIKNKR